MKITQSKTLSVPKIVNLLALLIKNMILPHAEALQSLQSKNLQFFSFILQYGYQQRQFIK
jgi:hypothetical protein